VLVVDDEPNILFALEETVRDLGFECIAACDGEEALIIARGVRPDLIITDVIMPGSTATSLCEKLKSDESTRSIPIVMVTVRAGDKDVKEGATAGADAYLIKPFHLTDLQKVIDQLLKLSGTEAAGADQGLPNDPGYNRDSAICTFADRSASAEFASRSSSGPRDANQVRVGRREVPEREHRVAHGVGLSLRRKLPAASAGARAPSPGSAARRCRTPAGMPLQEASWRLLQLADQAREDLRQQLGRVRADLAERVRGGLALLVLAAVEQLDQAAGRRRAPAPGGRTRCSPSARAASARAWSSASSSSARSRGTAAAAGSRCVKTAVPKAYAASARRRGPRGRAARRSDASSEYTCSG